ncbi:MAG: rRNA pseudouridine synthase, partial [Lentisphaeraceae bacterium]|nr:rRNA pseudouridine synthase [Lentisphaeraceae bacterium]
MRLAKFLAQAGVASRRKAEELIQTGKVIVNGQRCTEVVTIIDPDKDTVTYKGKVLRVKTSIYIALNKPTGYACTVSDPYEKKTIYRLLPRKERLFSVGRLDKNSEGLLLITNDGEFANKLMHPKYELEKMYKVSVSGEIVNRNINAVSREGIEHEGVFYQTKNIEISKKNPSGGQLIFTLTEGKKREIRKICAALGLRVKQLKRTRIGDLKL